MITYALCVIGGFILGVIVTGHGRPNQSNLFTRGTRERWGCHGDELPESMSLK